MKGPILDFERPILDLESQIEDLRSFADDQKMEVRDDLQRLEAKADKLRDIALLKIVDPPKKKLPAVRLARAKPVPGDPVIALGHAGAGMLWAIKAGEISALGKLSEHLATLASFKDDEAGR